MGAVAVSQLKGQIFVGLLLASLKNQGLGGTADSLDGSYRMLVGLIPLLLLVFLAVGFLEIAVPPDLIRGWLGKSSGTEGYLISLLTGALLPGGPYVTFPIIGAVYRAGAGLGQVVTMITAWSAVSIGLIIFELAFWGPRFTFVRIALMFWAPIAAGLLAQLFIS